MSKIFNGIELEWTKGMSDDDMISALQTYANLEGTEFGSACFMLGMIASEHKEMLSDKLYKAIMREIKENLILFNKQTFINVHEEMYTKMVEELEWIIGAARPYPRRE